MRESALLICSRAYKVFFVKMKEKELIAVAAAALYEVSKIYNFSECGRKLGVSLSAVRKLTGLWATKSEEIFQSSLASKQLLNNEGSRESGMMRFRKNFYKF